jgi:putative transcriptional regulator
MKKELFNELLASVRQGSAIIRGEMLPSRVFEFAEPDVRLIRERYGLTQEKFARLLGISVATLRNWEQGRRKPEGAARILLQVAVRHPEAVLDAVQNTLPRETEPNHGLQRTAGTAGGSQVVGTARVRGSAAPAAEP